MISENFEDILDNFKIITEENEVRGNEFADKVRNEYKNEIKDFIEGFVNDSNLYHIKGVASNSQYWAKNVEFRIGNYNSCKRFYEGLFVIYIFEKDGDGLYLNLNQGETTPTPEVRQEISERLIEFIDLNELNGFTRDFSDSVFHNEGDGIIVKHYGREELDEDTLKNDLREIINVYENIIPEYLNIIEEMGLNELIDTINSSGRNTLRIGSEDIQEESEEEEEELDAPEEEEEINELSYDLNDYDEENIINSDSFNFYDYLITKGFFFEKKTIENYLLSLKVKPFSILTGNSGTGKTKLSQLFAEYLGESGFHMVNVTTKGRSCGLSRNGTPGKRPGWTLSADDFREVLPLDEIEGSYEIEIGGHRTTANITFLPQIYYKRKFTDFLQHFRELYNNEEEQKAREQEAGIRHVDQKVKLGINCESIKSVILDECSQSDELTLTMNLNSTMYNGGSRVVLPQQIMDYIPLRNSIPCKITTDGLFAIGVFDLKFRISNYKTDEIQEYFETLNIGDSFELKIFGFRPDVEKFKNFKPNWVSVEYFPNGVSSDNYAIVPVGANWTENRNVVGYYNVLTKDYQHTQSLDLLLKAKEETNASKPYFLILDEMNLSHVERYFSDFLSAMESGKPIPLHKATEEYTGEIPEELSIPKNLFIVGTVNVDETTYMFSPKVLDRANVLEFKTFDKLPIINYIKNSYGNVDFKGNVNYLEDVLSDVDLRENILSIVNEEFANVEYEEEVEPVEDEPTEEVPVEEEVEPVEDEPTEEERVNAPIKHKLLEKIAAELTQFNEYLEDSGFEFGYRTVNEILAFMYVAWKYEGGHPIWNNWERYLDAQILQKILPKLHGSQIVIGESLDNILNYCLAIESSDEIPELSEINDDYPYPESAKKLIQMKKVLEQQRYVSFIN